MSHFFYIEEDKLPLLEKLFKNKTDGQFGVLNYGNNFVDIAQYSDKYQNVKIITVHESKLDWKRELN